MQQLISEILIIFGMQLKDSRVQIYFLHICISDCLVLTIANIVNSEENRNLACPLPLPFSLWMNLVIWIPISQWQSSSSSDDTIFNRCFLRRSYFTREVLPKLSWMISSIARQMPPAWLETISCKICINNYSKYDLSERDTLNEAMSGAQ